MNAAHLRRLVLAAALAGSPLAASQADLERHVAFLASGALEGRLTGSPGERQAADYLVAELARLGARPLPGREGYELPFTFTAGARDAGSSLRIAAGSDEARFSGAAAIQALSFSEDGEAAGEVVFAGYGLVVPDGQGVAYDSYAGLDVKDKLVVALRYSPEDAEPATRAVLGRYSGLRYKAMQARQRGAKALLVVTGPRSPNAGETVPMTFDTAISGSGIVAASLGGAAAERLFAAAGKSLADAQQALDDANPHATGFALAGVEVELAVEVERETRTGVNVVGLLPGGGAAVKPYVMLGAHYDHLGRGAGGSSLAKKGEEGGIHHGADDNASGVAAVLEAAGRLTASPRRRGVVIAFWSGEELGVLGSAHFAREGILAPADLAAYLNFDMVGRLRDNRLTLQAVGSSSVWPQLIEEVNVPLGFDLATTEDPYLPTDSSTFNQAGVPNLHFFTGSHEDYHRPTDTAEKIAYADLERVARFGALLAAKIADLDGAPDFVKVEPKAAGRGDRDAVRAFTGTIPDYTTEVQGLRLSGVIGGGPADEAGLTEGDVIVEFAGQTIANIYDYTYALDAVKVGVPVQVVFLRAGERREATIVPRARR